MEFSKKQRAFLKEFVNKQLESKTDASNDNSLFAIILNEIQALSIYQGHEHGSVNCDYDKRIRKYKGIHTIFEWLHFFEYLEKNNYVFILTARYSHGKGHFRDDVDISHKRGIKTIYDKATREIIVYCNEGGRSKEMEILTDSERKDIFPTTDLIELVKRKFRTPEQYKFMWGQIVAWTAIGISLFLGLIGIFCN